jgi:tetratricopeptide (TPR) repeat protein
VLLAGLAFAQSPDPRQLFEDAVAAQQRGDFTTAVQQYRRIVKLTPDALPAWINLGVALVQLQQYQEGIDAYQTALALDPGNKQVRFYVALAYYKKTDWANAARQLGEIWKDDPGNISAAILLGDCFLRLGDSGRALALVAPLATKAPDNLDLAWVYGSALIANGKLREGADVVERVGKDGHAADAYLLAGRTLLRLQLAERARDDLEAAVRLNPELPGAYTQLGAAREGNADFKGAEEADRKAVEQNPADVEAITNLGRVLYFNRDLPAARTALEQALRLDPSSIKARYAMALVKRASGDLQGAAADLETVVKANPNWMQAHVELAAVYFRLHRNEDGERERQIVDRLAEEERKAGPQ